MIFTSTVGLGSIVTLGVLLVALWWGGRRMVRGITLAQTTLAQTIGGAIVRLDETNGRARESIEDVNRALARIEMLETRLAASEQRVAILERYQIRVLDAEATVRGAGIHVPPPSR